MALDSLLVSEPLILDPPNAPETMSPGNRNFIGAVEDEWQLFSDRPDDYTMGDPIGFGASSIVYSALYRPVNEDDYASDSDGVSCALKVLDLDSLPPRSLYLLQRETTLMSLSKHPNVLRVRGSWMAGHKLHIALRLMNKGSAADVMRYGWPGGMEEEVVRCILRQALKGLNYLHVNGFIHRDIKAANLLIDDDGTVLLGDLGVAADLAEDTSPSRSHAKFITSAAELSQVNSSATSANAGIRAAFDGNSPSVPVRPGFGKRKSFVGTPCWMAPELIQGKQYDAKADIWSFGITALELTQGRPPGSRESPQRVLLRTIQEDAPTLDRAGGAYKYSRALKEIVDWCLNKDPAKRPSAKELLHTPFFKGAKKKSYLINAILKDLPPLTQRQERRPLPPVTSAASIDSWDFGTTIHSSPTTTIHRLRFSSGPEESTTNGVFFMEEDVCDGTEIEEPDIEVFAVQSSDSSLRSFGLDDGPSSIPNTSTPSSYTETSEMASRSQSTKSLTSEAMNSEPLASIAEHSNQPEIMISRTLPTSRKPISVTSRLSDSSSSSEGRRNLWQRLKTNVKSSPNNLPVSQSPGSSSSKSRISGMLSASKGLLTGNS